MCSYVLLGVKLNLVDDVVVAIIPYTNNSLPDCFLVITEVNLIVLIKCIEVFQLEG